MLASISMYLVYLALLLSGAVFLTKQQLLMTYHRFASLDRVALCWQNLLGIYLGRYI